MAATVALLSIVKLNWIDAAWTQVSIDCWAKIPAIAPCHVAVVTEGMPELARSPAA